MRNFVLAFALLLAVAGGGAALLSVAVLTGVTVVTGTVDQPWGGNGGGW